MNALFIHTGWSSRYQCNYSPLPKYFPINHRSGEIAVITHMFKNPIMNIRKISIIYCVNLVDAQGRNPKSYISNPSPALLPSVIPQLVSNYMNVLFINIDQWSPVPIVWCSPISTRSWSIMCSSFIPGDLLSTRVLLCGSVTSYIDGLISVHRSPGWSVLSCNIRSLSFSLDR